MHSFTAFTAVTVSLPLVLAVIVPRAQPADWPSSLENWNTYHVRYLAEDCEAQHGTTFFDQCCHPLQASQTVADLPSTCNSVDHEDINDGNSDECDDGSPTPTPTPTPSVIDHVAAVTQTASTSSFTTGGFITWYTQNGNAGACGDFHQDTDLICAMDSQIFNMGLCGKQVLIEANGKSVTVTVADECPTCKNAQSIDLSVGAFEALDPNYKIDGALPMKWRYV